MGDIRSNISIAGPAGEGPDIIVAAHDWIGELVLNGSVVPIDLGPVADSYNPAALSLFTYNGQLYGVPYAVENVALFYNTELVPTPPATWDEVRSITEGLVTAGTSQYGYMIQTNDAYHWFPEFSAFGGYVFGRDAEGNYDPSDIGIDSEGAIAAGQWLQGMAEAGYIVPDVNYDVMHAMFESGDAAMIVTGPWALPRIKESGIPYAIAPIPAGPAGPGTPFIGGQGFMISAYSENQLLAESFLIDFMSNLDPMRAMYNADPRPPAYLPLLDELADPDFLAFQAAGEVGVPLPSIPEMATVWGSWGGAQQFIITQELDAETALTEAATAIRELVAGSVSGATASETGETVGLPGTIQTAVGCAADWDPACEQTLMVVGEDDGIWQAAYDLPAGDYEYKVALNGTWDENYGAGGEQDGANVTLSLAEDTHVFFFYDPVTHYVTDSVNSLIVTAPGSYQAAIGCAGDWAPDCLLSWLEDADGDGVYTLTTTTIPAGDYEVKAALNQSWDENYGAEGERDGANIPFNVPADGASVTFSYDSATNLLTVTVE
jgi:maltose/maltodextrin transport system substrate-binding protein/arabinogalactan oligomer/maltooligosaccharide transport system substrate-binding protein